MQVHDMQYSDFLVRPYLICEEQGIALKEFDASAIEELKKLHWSGNVRELRNVVERLIILAGKVVTAEDVKVFATFSSL